MVTTTTARGNQAESRALAHLESNGCQFLVRNYRTKAGEIDIIVQDNQTLVFVEVRYRSDSSRGTGAETVTHGKRLKIIKTAERFLATHKQFRNMPCRFDVISMGRSIDWIKRAFTLDA
ncbi:MAG: YraN family protein [Gammaproteobacteria bacterium]|nr:YraN family protein [Gammaproteobacteria bacterium]